MKRFAVILVAIVALIILGLWSPWNKWDVSIPQLLGYNPPTKYAGLQVSSLNGTLSVFIDDNLIGTVNKENSPLANFQITPGERLVRIERTSEPAGFYKSFSKVINFVAGIDVIIGYELGPSEQFHEGHILYAIPKRTSGPVQLEVKPVPADAAVFLDEVRLIGGKSENLSLSEQHKVKVTADGYEPLEFTILPASQTDRDKLKDYDLVLETEQFQIPIEVISN